VKRATPGYYPPLGRNSGQAAIIHKTILTAGKTAREGFMKRKSELIIVLFMLALAAASGYAQTADPSRNFDFVIEGNEAYITGYKGNSLTPRIPSTIQGKKVTRIGDKAFLGNRLACITIPDSVTTIGQSAFSGNRLTSVTIGKGVTEIYNAAFAENEELTSVTIGANVILGIEGGGTSNSFDDFDYFYNDNGKRAGTYTYSNDEWRRQ
jgi:hypothetical protein